MANINALHKSIKENKFFDSFKRLYVDEMLFDAQKERYIRVLKEFESNFKTQEVSVYSAPGRSEIGGNHTDHQNGCVLAAAVNLDTLAVVSKREDNQIHVISKGFTIQPITVPPYEVDKAEVQTTEALIRGICARIHELGFVVGGLNIYMESDVLEGAGLSSSASVEVLIATILSGEYNDFKISPIEIAKIGQYSENNYFLKPCGLMDQMACSVGGFIGIDFKEPNNPIVEKIDFNFDEYKHTLCIVDTKGSHADLTDDYAAIPLEMKKIAKHFHKAYLSEVNEQEFYKEICELRSNYGDRSVLRAIHFFNENGRVKEEVNALKKANFERFKELIKESGNSSYKYLQNVYTPKDIMEQNLSLGLAISEHILKDKGVSRVHGGGFAGTIQAFVPNDLLATYQKEMEMIFGQGSCYSLKIRSDGGVKVV